MNLPGGAAERGNYDETGTRQKTKKKVEQLLDKHKYLEAKKLLRQIEQYKPISLETIVLSARYAMMTGNHEVAFNRLMGKWCNHFAYEGVDETFQLYEELWKSEETGEWDFDRIHHMRRQLQFIGTDTEEARELQQNFTQLKEWGDEFYSTGSENVLNKIQRLTYTVSEVIWNYAIQIYFKNKGKDEYLPPCLGWMGNLTNMGYFKERLEESGAVFLLVAEESNEVMCRAIGRMLREMDKIVYFLMVPQQAEAGKEEDMQTLVDKSIKHCAVDAYGINMVPTWVLEDTEGGAVGQSGTFNPGFEQAGKRQADYSFRKRRNVG